MPTESKPLQIFNAIVEKAIDGQPPVITSAQELADEYIRDASYNNNIERVDALIRLEATKSSAVGFVTSLGGLITLPASIPLNMFATFIIQARMSAAIAILLGHNPHEEKVKTIVMLTLLGDYAKNTLKDAGIKVANNMTEKLIMKIPGRVLIEINKKIGFSLLTKAGERGLVNLIKCVPIAGGIVGGTIDSTACLTVGNIAKKVFS